MERPHDDTGKCQRKRSASPLSVHPPMKRSKQWPTARSISQRPKPRHGGALQLTKQLAGFRSLKRRGHICNEGLTRLEDARKCFAQAPVYKETSRAYHFWTPCELKLLDHLYSDIRLARQHIVQLLGHSYGTLQNQVTRRGLVNAANRRREMTVADDMMIYKSFEDQICDFEAWKPKAFVSSARVMRDTARQPFKIKAYFKANGHLWGWSPDQDDMLKGYEWNQFHSAWAMHGEKFKARGHSEQDCERHLIMLTLGEKGIGTQLAEQLRPIPELADDGGGSSRRTEEGVESGADGGQGAVVGEVADSAEDAKAEPDPDHEQDVKAKQNARVERDQGVVVEEAADGDHKYEETANCLLPEGLQMIADFLYGRT